MEQSIIPKNHEKEKRLLSDYNSVTDQSWLRYTECENKAVPSSLVWYRAEDEWGRASGPRGRDGQSKKEEAEEFSTSGQAAVIHTNLCPEENV